MFSHLIKKARIEISILSPNTNPLNMEAPVGLKREELV